MLNGARCVRCRFKHKTSKARRASTSPLVRQMVISSCVYARLQFYGAAKTSMSPLVSKWVDAYVAAIELDFADRPYLVSLRTGTRIRALSRLIACPQRHLRSSTCSPTSSVACPARSGQTSSRCRTVARSRAQSRDM